jgi:glucose/arabinose dehydrogenase
MTTGGAGQSYRAALLLFLLAACGPSGDSPPSAPHPPPVLRVQRVFPALTFNQPVAMLQAPGDATRWFVVEQGGTVRAFANTPQVTGTTLFADITDRVAAGGEMGLLGMAFHPDFPMDPRVYLSYSNVTSGRVNRVSEFTLDANDNVDRSTERIILSVNQPEANHNGGQITFGPVDGLLYIGRGDGGGANDQHGAIGNGQLMTALLGKLLRIDVDVIPPALYAIPSDNPFAGNPLCGPSGGTQPCPEIYASGLRNPWRWSFDRGMGTALWLGDVGQSAREEVNRITLGGNYGWRCFEGTLDTGLACGSEQGLQRPIAEYGRAQGASVTGGFVYRGTVLTGLVGRYVFGDFVSGRLWHIAAEAQPTLQIGTGFDTGLNISSFGEDAAGELYVVDYNGGIYRIIGG